MSLKLIVEAKCDDRFSMQFTGYDDEPIRDYQGHVPSFLSRDADYLVFQVDLATGRMTLADGSVPTADAVRHFFNEQRKKGDS